MPLKGNEKYTRFLINGFSGHRIAELKDLCNDAIKNIPGVRCDYYAENGGFTLQLYGVTEKAVDDAFTIIKLNQFTY